jgi:hypothetical protein
VSKVLKGIGNILKDGVFLRHLFYFRTMLKEEVLKLIDEKLQQIEEAETKNMLNGNLNFGLHLHLYRQ